MKPYLFSDYIYIIITRYYVDIIIHNIPNKTKYNCGVSVLKILELSLKYCRFLINISLLEMCEIFFSIYLNKTGLYKSIKL